MLYAGVFALTGSIMVFGLATRSSIELSALKDRALPFVTLASGDIRNAYTINVVNKQHVQRDVALTVAGLPGATFELIGAGDNAIAHHLVAEPDAVDTYRLLVTAPASALTSNTASINVVLSDAGETLATASTRFLGPER